MKRFNFQFLKNVFTLCASVIVFATAGYGVYWASRSPLFLIRVVEVADSTPEQFSHILELAQVPLNQINLFEVDLKKIENRIVTDPWVRSVVIQKILPATLQIQVTYREPVALVQEKRGRLRYVDAEGFRFGKISLIRELDLPLIHLPDLSEHLTDSRRDELLKEAVAWIQLWNQQPVSSVAQLSSLAYSPEQGFRAWISYALGKGREARSRPLLQMTKLDAVESKQAFERLTRVFHYLSDNAVPTRQIFADSGKKVVVKIRRDS